MARNAPPLPRGRVTFVFTDVVGSTRTFVEHGEAYAVALTALHARIAEHAGRRNGVVVETEGDGAFLAFPDAISATEAVIALQGELETATHPGLRLRLRAGAHTGDASPVGGHYLALAVYVAARVSAAANAGQLLVTEAVIEELTESGSTRAARAVEVGSYSLKDIPDPVSLWRLSGDADPPRATPARRTNVRQSRTSFVGREQALDRLLELTATPGLVTAVGPGGVGKTRLVSEFALRDAETFAGGAWLVELSTLDVPDQVLPTTGAALGLNSASLDDVSVELKRRGRTLLVLDNCEHLVDPVVELIDALLNACPELTVLCTSREALRMADELVCAISPLPVGGPAIQLFLERSESADAPELDRELVRQICEVLDGLPLAIELAASQTREAPLRELLDTVQTGTETLARRGGHERQRSLDTVLQWSVARLTPRLRDSLLVLSVFPGRFSPDMAASVLQGVPSCDAAATKELAGRSLVDLDGDDYRLLVTVRGAARRLLTQAPELRRNALDAVVEWTRSFGAERWEIPGYHLDVPPDTLLAMEVGLARALDADISGLGKAWYAASQMVTHRATSEALLAIADRALAMPVSDHDAVLVLNAAARISAGNGGPQKLSPGQISAMLELAREPSDPELLVRALVSAAEHEEAAGNMMAARPYRLERLELVRNTSRLSHELPGALTSVANNYYWAGDWATSFAYAEEAFAASEGPEFQMAHAIASLNLSDDHLVRGNDREALEYALLGLRISEPDWLLRSTALSFIARAHARLGDRESALAAGREALPVLRETAKRDKHMAEELVELLDEVPELGP